MAIFDRFRKQKNQSVVQEPGKHRLSLADIAETGGHLRIRDVSNQLWFPAGQPINPVAPRGTPPRRYPYQPMSNINWVTREGQIDHQALRNFSYYPIVRDIIETLKDLLTQIDWEFVLMPKDETESGQQLRARAANDKRLGEVRKFFRKPDGWQPFRVWSRGLYDDMLVLDAASIWKQRDQEGRVCSLVQIDGSQVFPLIDETGQQPDAAPYDRVVVQTSTKKAEKDYLDKVKDKQTERSGLGSPAFQLTPYGFPAQEMTSKELLYAVYNRFTYKRYGFSRVETCLAYIAIALGRLDFQAAFYRSGSVPEGIAFLPPDVPIQKVDELNKYLDTILAGNLKNRRKIFFLPSYGTDKQPNIIFPKVNEQVLKDEFDEWLARVLCHCFGLSPMAFTKQINRGEAGHMEQAQGAEAVAPCLAWMKDVLDQIIQEDFGYDDIEARPQQKPEQDLQKLTTILMEQLTNGMATLNQVCEQLGYDTYDEEWAQVPLVKTTNGFIRLDGKNMDGSEPEPEQPPTPIPAGAVPTDGKKPTAQGGGGTPPPKKAPSKPEPPKKGGSKQVTGDQKKKPEKAEGDSLNKDELPEFQEGLPAETVHGEDDWITAPPSVQEQLHLAPDFEPAYQGTDDPENVPHVDREDQQAAPQPWMDDWMENDEALKAATKIALEKARPKRDPARAQGDGKNWPNMETTNAYIGASRLDPKSKEARQAIYHKFASLFSKIRNHYKARVAKAEGDDLPGNNAKEVEDGVMRHIEQEFWRLGPDLSLELKKAATAGTLMSVRDLDLNDTGMIERVNIKALEHAEKRGAEMVGTGKNSLTDTTRDAIKNLIVKTFKGDITLAAAKDEIQTALHEDGPDGVFSDFRAKTIARQEVAKAQAEGQMSVWKASGIPLKKKWLATSEEPCVDCDSNDGEVVDLEDDFPSGDFSPADVHPWCNCIVLATLGDEED